MPSTEYLSNHNLALHKILPSNPPPRAIQRRIDSMNAAREYARQEYERNLDAEIFWIPAGPTPVDPTPTCPTRPRRPCAADLPPIAPDEIPVFHFPIAGHDSTEVARLMRSESQPASEMRKLRKRSGRSGVVLECPRPDQYRTRRGFEQAYIRHVEQYGQQQHPTEACASVQDKHQRVSSSPPVVPAPGFLQDISAPQAIDGNDDDFYWDDRMPLEQAEYVQSYVQQAALDNLVNEVFDAMPESETDFGMS